MVAIVTGNGLGLLGSSLGSLGGAGGVGSSNQGNAAEKLFINAKTGNLVVQRLDELLRSLGPDAGLLRTYNSQGQRNDDNADNWRLGLSRKIFGLTGTVNTVGSSIVRVDEDGAEVRYTYDAASGQYVSHVGGGAFDTLTYNAAAGNWIWRDGDRQVTERYNSHTSGGQLQTITDHNGKTLTLSYTGTGAGSLVTRIETSSGERIDIVYDRTAGKTANILEMRTQTKVAGTDTTYQTSTHVRYTYDAKNRLQSVSIDLTPDDNSVVDGKTYLTRYSYDGNSNRIASIVQTDGSEVRFTYDSAGRVVTVADVRSATDSRITTLAYGTNQTTVTDALGHSRTLSYDTNGQLTRIHTPLQGDVADATNAADTAFSYDARGNVTQTTDARGQSVTYRYDDNNNRIYQRDGAGNVMEWQYSSQNALLTETIYRVTDPDGAGVELPSQPLVTRYAYDAQGNLRFRVSAEGRVTELRYDALGQESSRIVYTAGLYTGVASDLAALSVWVILQTPIQTQRVDTAYDFRGQVQSVTRYSRVDAAGNGVRDGSQSETHYVYDQYGQLLQTIDPRGVATTGIANDYITTYTYDGLGRVLATMRTDQTGNSLTLASHVYHDAQQRSMTTLANGLVTTTTYDRAGHVISTVQTDSSTATAQQMSRTEYVYDKKSRPIAQRVTTGNGSVLSSYMVYDNVGNKVAEIDATGAVVEYVYNKNGQVIRRIAYHQKAPASVLVRDPSTLTLASLRSNSTENRITQQLYDQAGRLVKTIDAEGAVVAYAYDGASRLIQTIAYSYRLQEDKLAILLATTSEIDPTDSNTIRSESPDRITRHFYHDDGLLLGVLDAQGYLAENVYDAAGQLTQTIRYATATARNLRATASSIAALRPAVHPDDISNRVFYNGQGQVVGHLDGEGYLTEIAYDVAGNVTQTIRYATRVTVADAADLSVADLRPVVSVSDQRTVSQYDADNRVTRQENHPSGLITVYTYDAVGNMTSMTQMPDDVAQRQKLVRYDVLGRVIAELSAENAARITGGMSQVQIDAIWNSYATRHTYDQANRLTHSTDALGRRSVFYYNEQGRLSTTINAAGEVKRNIYNSFGEVVERWHYKGTLTSAQYAPLQGGTVDVILDALLNGIAAVGIVQSKVNRSLRGEIKDAFDALGNKTSYSYMALGELFQSSQKERVDRFQVDHRYDNFYDSRGLLKQVTQYQYQYQTEGDLSTGNYSYASAVTRTTYDAFGRVVSRIAPNGVSSSTQYDKLGQQISTRVGATYTTLTYDAFGRTLTIGNGDGQTRTVYDDATHTITTTSAEGIVTSSVYNAFGELVSVTDGRGNTTSYQYNKDGRLISVTDPAGSTSTSYDAASQQISTTDRNGTITQFAYDALGRVLSRTVDPGGLNLTTRTRYDALGRANWVQDANGIWTRSDYDDRGQVILVEVDPTGLAIKTAYTYDAQGKVLTVTEAVGTSAARVTAYGYDAQGSRISEIIDPHGLAITTQYRYDRSGNVIQKTDANGNVSHYGYDGNGRLMVTVDASGAVTRTVYDAQNRVTAIHRYSRLVSTTSLGVVGNASIGVRWDSDLLALLPMDASYTSTQYAYDGDGRLVLTVDAVGVVHRNTYDEVGNVIAKTTYARPIALSAGTSGQTIEAALVIDAQDQTIHYVFDAANRLIESHDGVGVATRYAYDANGNVTDKTIAFGTSDAATTHYVYDQVGRMTAQTVAFGTASQATTSYQYDARGNLVAETDPRGVELVESDSTWARNQRHALGYHDQSTNVLLPAASLTAEQKTALMDKWTSRTTYDAAGRKVQTRDALGNITRYAYDARGNLTKLTDPRGNSAYFYYDTDNRRTLYVDPEGYVSKTEYDANDNVSTITQYATKATGSWSQTNPPAVLNNAAQDRITHYEYDQLGRQTQITDAQGFEESRRYDAFGNLASLTNKVGGVTTYTYDARGLPLTETLPITSANASGTQVAVVNQFIYDSRGNRIQTIEAVGLPEQRTTTYAYDQQDRLISKTGQATAILNDSFSTITAASTNTYQYDLRGNQTVVDSNGRRTVAYYDANNRKTAEVNAGGTLTTWGYDRAGNAVVKRIYGDALALPVDASTEVSPVNMSNYRETLYTFNVNNHLTGIQQVSNTTFYSYDMGMFQGSVETTQTVDVNGNVTSSRDANLNTSYYFYDAVGNKTLQVDAMGYGIAWTYNAAGEVIRETRYASKLDNATLTALRTTSNATTLQAQFAAGSNATEDRITEMVYDRMGRVVEQRVLNVAASSVNSTTGALTHSVIAAITGYQYNGLGKVIQQTDAKMNVTDIGYDALGRELLRQMPQFSDGASTVREQIATTHNGLNQITSITQLGKTVSENRTQSLRYNAAGGLTSRTDAMGYTTSYGLNIHGETVQTTATRTKPDHTTTTEVTRYTYDAMGRQVEESDQSTNTTSNIRYDAYGAMTGKGTNGIYSQVTEYDDLGRIWRTNNGDGITKAFVYDRNGNATMQIQSAGADLTNRTLVDMLFRMPDQVRPTITVYDKRNQVTDVIQPKMQFVHEDAGVEATQIQVTSDPFAAGNLSLSAGHVTRTDHRPTVTIAKVFDRYGRIAFTGNMPITLTLPDLSAYGTGNIRVVVSSGSTVIESLTYPGGQSSINFVVNGVDRGFVNDSSYSSTYTEICTTVYKETPYGNVLISSINMQRTAGTPSTSNAISTPKLIFKGQPLSTELLTLKYRPAGSTGAYTEVMVPKFQINGNFVAGQFAYDWSTLPTGNYEYQYEAFDNTGKVLNRVAGQMNINGASSAIVSQNAQQLDSVYQTQIKWVITGTQAVENQIHQTQERNAFGEVVTEIDGLGRRTEFTYNTLGKLVLKRDPETDITLANGFTHRAAPETRYYYDALGQVVGVLDANGHLNTMRYTEGLSSGPQVAQEYHADGGVRSYQYDVFGQLAALTDEIGQVTRQSYDKNGNLILVDRVGSNDDRYEYDEVGNRIAHTNGLNNRETWTFDSLGRIVRATSLAGRMTTTSYVWDGSITALSGSLAVGGWLKTITDANGRSTQDKSDVYGRIRWGKDLGNHTVSYSYNAAGWLAQQTSSAGQHLTYDYYDNGYVKSITDTPNNSFTKYEYDDAGNRTFEGYTSASGNNREYYQYAEITYDELNRVKTVTDPKYQITYEYDAAGNRRRVLSTYHDGVGGNRATQDYWYLYDSMNRFTLTKGALTDGRATSAAGSAAIVKGADGVQIGYDLAGQRTSAVYADHAESYEYQYGLLTNTRIDGVLRASRNALDATGNLSNQVNYIEYNANGSVRTNTTYTYDADNLVTRNHDNVTGQGTTYAYLADGTLSTTVTYGQATTVTTSYTYEWWSKAKESEIRIQASNATVSGWRPGFSRMTYDVNGNLKEVHDVDGGRSLRYVTNGEGLILSRSEIVNNTIAKNHNWYYANGRQIGDVGNDGQSNEDYAQALAQDKGLTRKEINQRFKPMATADFDQNYQPINAHYPALTASNYMVKEGDSLQSVAAAMWGDASLWYLIADANGLTSASMLTAGTSLVIPNKVANIHNASSTFKVYNPGEKIGDTSPTLPEAPPPPVQGKKGCGGIGMILVIVVAVVATAGALGVLAGAPGGLGGAISAGFQAMASGSLAGLGTGTALGGALTTAGNFALAGAVGSIASQGVAMAMGMQDQFSWRGVALSAAASGLSVGIGNSEWARTTLPGGWQGAAARATASNVATQGIGVVTGIQKKFDWRGVAAAGVGAGVSTAIGGGAFATDHSKFAGRLAGGVAAGAVLSSGRFNSQTVAGVIGNLIGESIGDQFDVHSGIRNQSSIAGDDDPLGDFINANQARWTTISVKEGSEKVLSAVYSDQEKQSVYQNAITQGLSPNDAEQLASWVDLKRHADGLYERTIGMSNDDPNLTSTLRTAKVLTDALVSKDIYFNESISGLLPNGVSRLDDAALASINGLNYTNSDFIDADSGYFGALYRNAMDNSYTYANRGSENFQDYLTNGYQAFGFKEAQFDKAIRIANNLNGQLNGDVSFTGHSLGGGLAAAQAMATNGQAITFNAEGVSNGTIRRFGLNADGVDQRITAFNVDGEILSRVQDSPLTSLIATYYGTVPKNMMAAIGLASDMLTGRQADFSRFGFPMVSSAIGTRIEIPAVTLQGETLGPLGRLTNTISTHTMDYVLKSLQTHLGRNGTLPPNYLGNIR